MPVIKRVARAIGEGLWGALLGASVTFIGGGIALIVIVGFLVPEGEDAPGAGYAAVSLFFFLGPFTSAAIFFAKRFGNAWKKTGTAQLTMVFKR